ncbi:MAG: PadR family transcriptional regulator [Thermoplasmata archaeon]|nr:PadR family transcriptional regulator [Thermoplasmata archaeon]
MWGRKKRGLRTWVLMIIRRQPRNGAEIIDDMEVMTRGWWRPSPGSVYPMLEEMVSEGAIRKRPDGRYELVGDVDPLWGWHMGSGPRTPQDVLQEISGLTAYLEDLRRSQPSATQPIQTELDAVAERLRKLRN